MQALDGSAVRRPGSRCKRGDSSLQLGEEVDAIVEVNNGCSHIRIACNRLIWADGFQRDVGRLGMDNDMPVLGCSQVRTALSRR